jgi:hypothetical protein
MGMLYDAVRSVAVNIAYLKVFSDKETDDNHEETCHWRQPDKYSKCVPSDNKCTVSQLHVTAGSEV